MDIVDDNIKRAMLAEIVNAIIDPADPNSYNEIKMQDVDGNELASIVFNKVEIDSTSVMSIIFKNKNSETLSGYVDNTGVVSTFTIDNIDGVSGLALQGKIGNVIDTEADLIFNNVNWQKDDTITLDSVRIVLEDVCLHQ